MPGKCHHPACPLLPLIRLNANYQVLKWVMIIGTTLHGVTHLLQAILLTAFFIGEEVVELLMVRSFTGFFSRPLIMHPGIGQTIEERGISTGVFAFMLMLSICLVAYQFYIERVFYLMWIKVTDGL